MGQIRFAEKKNVVKIEVVKDTYAGDITRVLEFDCSPQKYEYIKVVERSIALTEKKINDGAAIVEITNDIEACFEMLAPGKWGEFLEFLDHDVFNMIVLLSEMIKTVAKKGYEAKSATVAPVEPAADAEQV